MPFHLVGQQTFQQVVVHAVIAPSPALCGLCLRRMGSAIRATRRGRNPQGRTLADLSRMVKNGAVTRAGQGTRGNPYLYA